MRGPEYLRGRVKRSLDLAIAYGSLPLSSPIFIVMYCYNRQRGEPLFFRQPRIGQDGKSFCIYKFETLYTNAENSDFHHLRLYYDPKQKDREDPRTPNKAMKLMRRTGLNELPQLLNIIRGEMSIVGPRPQVPEYIAEAEFLFPEITCNWKNTALTVRPGVIGVSPLTTRGLSVAQFDQTAAADTQYYNEATFFTDLGIIAQAVICISRSVKQESIKS